MPFSVGVDLCMYNMVSSVFILHDHLDIKDFMQ